MNGGSTSPNEDDQRFRVRRLQISDKNKGFLDLLQQLSPAHGSVSEREFVARYQELDLLGDDHLVCVIEDEPSHKIIGTGTIFIELKFLRSCGKVGHIEDVVVDGRARGKHLGKKIVEFLEDYARLRGCYKVILDCRIENGGFYEKCGFKEKEIQMVKYFV